MFSNQRSAAAYGIALAGFVAGGALSALSTWLWVSRRPRNDFDLLETRRAYVFHEDDPEKQTSTTIRSMKSLNSQAQFCEYQFLLTGDAHSQDLTVQEPEYRVFGPVPQGIWTTYFIYLGGPVPRGQTRRVEFQQTVDDPLFTMTPMLTVGGRADVIELSVTFSSKKQPAAGRVWFRETSKQGPHRCFTERIIPLQNLNASHRIQGTREDRSYGLHWEWDAIPE